MNETVKVKCPGCGKILILKNQPGIENKNITCPICGSRGKFVDFLEVPSRPSAPAVSSHGGELTEVWQPGSVFSLGRLIVVPDGYDFELSPGQNVVGRRSARSLADFQIDTKGDLTMSREHIIIETKNEREKGVVSYLLLAKPDVNPTYIGRQRIIFGEKVELKNGDMIALPGIMLRYEKSSL